ncbi:hypothetical protein Pla110_06700 [Polystyrenella longa]|uniref:Uncharacterized protein n=1 Tax=Polystyrenella longa TaxID=2528007 RepID=A0A518CIA3_9PLAN|nr:hypothetical protein [Polystyrenella longa]QDU78966.1 hypothetical protein Pla110_06700 [Polystyrenella longa]
MTSHKFNPENKRNTTNKLHPKGPLIWFVAIGVGVTIFMVFTAMGYNSGSGNVVQAGSVEINPEYIKILLSLSALFIPWINSKWPLLGDLLARLLNQFVDPEESPTESVQTKTETEHFCDLHEIGLQFAHRNDNQGIQLCTQLFERLLKHQKPEPEDTEG